MFRLGALLAVFLSLLCVAQSLEDLAPRASKCQCFTATETTGNPKCPRNPNCPVGNCIIYTTTTIPPEDKACPTTLTTAVPSPCPTPPVKCPPPFCGAVITETETGCFTATKTSFPKICSCPGQCVKTVTTTRPPKLCACPTTTTQTVFYDCSPSPKCPAQGCLTKTKTVTATH